MEILKNNQKSIVRVKASQDETRTSKYNFNHARDVFLSGGIARDIFFNGGTVYVSELLNLMK